MNESRGSNLTGTYNYLEKVCTTEQLAAFSAEWPAELQKQVGRFQQSSWYPLEWYDLFAQNAASLATEPEEVFAHMRGCGDSIAATVANSFMKLMLKMLTPGLVARKLPDLWARDWTFGTLILVECDATIGKLEFEMQQISPVVYMGPIAGGYVGRVLETLTGSATKVVTDNFSLDTPRPERTVVTVTW